MDKDKVRSHDAKINALFRFFDNFIIFLMVYWVGGSVSPGQESFYFWLSLGLILFYNYFAESYSVYSSWRGGEVLGDFFGIISAWFLALFFVFLIGLVFVGGKVFLQLDSLFQAFVFIFIVPVILSLFHFLSRFTLGFMKSIGVNSKSVAIYGATSLGRKLSTSFGEMPWSGFVFKGFYDDRGVSSLDRRVEGNVVGGIDVLIKDCRSGKIEGVYIALSLSAENRVKEIIKELADTTVSVYLVPDVFTFDLLYSKIEDCKGVPVISIYETPFSGVNYFIKRLEDIVLSLLILVLISIPLLLIAIGVRLSSSGPVLFKQLRYGLDGKKFEVWKFRSMTVMENSDNIVQATKNDTRVTAFGSFIRRTSLDELPQFFNVLSGSMSIVGPRPHAVLHNEEYRKLIPGYMLRHKIKPGITGLAQVKGFRGETDTLDKMEQRVHYDLMYIRSWSVFLDLKIVFMTIFKGFSHKNAY